MPARTRAANKLSEEDAAFPGAPHEEDEGLGVSGGAGHDRPKSGRVGKDKGNKKGKGKGKRKHGLDGIYQHTAHDMDLFLKESRNILDAAVKRAMNPKKKGWELHFEASLLGELANMTQHAAKAAAAAAMTASAAAAATAAALRGAVEIEPLLEAYKAPPPREKTPEPEEKGAPRWGYTKARSSKILKPLGFLNSDDAAAAKKKKKKARRLRDEELPAVLKKKNASIVGDTGFDPTSYAAKKAARIQAAKARRGSNLAVALPPISKKGGKKKGGKAGSGQSMDSLGEEEEPDEFEGEDDAED